MMRGRGAPHQKMSEFVSRIREVWEERIGKQLHSFDKLESVSIEAVGYFPEGKS